MTLPKGASRLSSQKRNEQPPKRKSLVGSSSGPPGACITPSSDWKTAPVSLRIDALARDGRLDLGDVDLLHRHHRLECPLGGAAVGIVQRLEQHARRDLPGEAPLVLAPAALAFLPAIIDNRVPIWVGLSLFLGHDHEADGLIRREVGPAVKANKGLAEHGE